MPGTKLYRCPDCERVTDDEPDQDNLLECDRCGVQYTAEALPPALGFTIGFEWDPNDRVWCAFYIRDGEPWYLEGSLVGVDTTPLEALDDLLGLAQYLVEHGMNALMGEPLSLVDRHWLFRTMDGTDVAPEVVQRLWQALQRAERTGA